VSDHVGYLGDVMATAAELAGVEPPADIDSISFARAAMANDELQPEHEFLYWEFYESGSAQAVRMGPWKGLRQPMFTGPIELYDLRNDPGEQLDVSEDYPDVVRDIEAVMDDAHQDDPLWTVLGQSNTNR
jgi:uncharacterized sulfatase